jgi:hypothetical protein
MRRAGGNGSPGRGAGHVARVAVTRAREIASHVSPGDVMYKSPVAQKSLRVGSEMAGGGRNVGPVCLHRAYEYSSWLLMKSS